MWRCASCTRETAIASPFCLLGGWGARGGGGAGGAAPAPAPASLSSVPEVQIDADGVFKYVLITVEHGGGARHTLVRGHAWAAYHDDVFQHYRPSLAAVPGVTSVSCPGGGRIAVDAILKRARVYGHSIGYGRAKHAVTAAALTRALPGWAVTHDNEGY